jgi:dipeptidyl-peptidase-4
MALNCILKGADVFALAVAVAPVTSWRYYDTIYTEIYNGLPEDNPAGYDDNSPLNFADRLAGKLLLIHGTGDDNVHAQNSYEMAKALVKAGKQFDMMLYTDDNHSMRPTGSRHVRQKIVDYVTRNL